eukprot:2448760-Prymnesium_polylepis.1
MGWRMRGRARSNGRLPAAVPKRMPCVPPHSPRRHGNVRRNCGCAQPHSARAVRRRASHGAKANHLHATRAFDPAPLQLSL